MHDNLNLSGESFALNPLLREDQVVKATGDRGRSTLWTKVKAELITPPVRVGPRSNGWPAREIAAINAAIIAGKTKDEIRTLVRQLVAERPGLLAQFEQQQAV